MSGFYPLVVIQMIAQRGQGDKCFPDTSFFLLETVEGFRRYQTGNISYNRT